MPKIIAFVSTRKIPISAGLRRTKRRPSTIERSPGRSTSPSGLIRGNSHAAPEGGAIGGEVDAVRRGQADHRDQHAGKGGAGDEGEVAVDALERDRGRELVVADETWRDRAHRRPREAPCRRAERLEHEQRPDLRVRQERVDEQQAGDGAERELGDDHDAPAVERVRDRAADERHDEERDERREREQPDEQRRVGQLVDLERDRDHRDRVARVRDGLADPETAERLRLAERRHVDGEPLQQARTRGLTGRVLDVGERRRVGHGRPGYTVAGAALPRSRRAGCSRGRAVRAGAGADRAGSSGGVDRARRREGDPVARSKREVDLLVRVPAVGSRRRSRRSGRSTRRTSSRTAT